MCDRGGFVGGKEVFGESRERADVVGRDSCSLGEVPEDECPFVGFPEGVTVQGDNSKEGREGVELVPQFRWGGGINGPERNVF